MQFTWFYGDITTAYLIMYGTEAANHYKIYNRPSVRISFYINIFNCVMSKYITKHFNITKLNFLHKVHSFVSCDSYSN